MLPLIPRDVLFGNPERLSPAISPEGGRLAYIAPDDGVLNVWIRTVGREDDKAVTDDRDRGIRQYWWARDGRHVLYAQDRGGDENWRLYTVDLETSAVVDRTPFEGVQATVVAIDKRHPDDVVIALNKDNPQLHDLYRLHLPSGELTKLVENPGFVAWLVDRELQVRGGIVPTPTGGGQLLVKDGDGWRPLLELSADDFLNNDPLGFAVDGSAFFMALAGPANAKRLVRIDVKTGDATEIAGDPINDVAGAVFDTETGEPVMVAFNRSRLEWAALDPAFLDDLDALTKVHDGDMQPQSRDNSGQMWTVAFTSDRGPVAYYAYDRRNRTATFLFDHRSDLAGYTMASMEPFAYTARDGLRIEGYLSFPPEAGRTKLPTVLLVHGGPWHRDSWGLDPIAQWLANRGYLCVQMNFRGSTGYGRDFLNAGDKEWGGKMQDDVTDAARYVIEQGWADPARLGIMGGSYGGFATLAGMTFTPELYACGVDIVGPSSLKSFIEGIPEYWKPMIAMLHERVGDPATEEAFLWSRSPLSRVDAIRAPLLIAQGANDPRVPQAESEQIVATMRERGVDHEYLVFEDEGHGFAKPENSLRFFAAAERFLARHLGGRCEEEPANLDPS